ncbi:MAG TPA: PilZ domain-containing protein [Blastocatellia bacterium]|nr:PilZ domain-containing protein [Blastocatellia bacterium]
MNNSGLLIQRAMNRASTGKLISAYYLEIEPLLERVERSKTHYQTLGLERSATSEQIILAYHHTVKLLHPSYYKVRAAVPDDMLARIDLIFGKVSQAMFVLTTPHKRLEYDESLRRPARNSGRLILGKLNDESEIVAGVQASAVEQETVKQVAAEQKAVEQKAAEQRQVKPAAQKTVDINVVPIQRPVFTKLASEEKASNRRRSDRFNLSVPVLVAGYDGAGCKWQEVTKTVDVSRLGVAVKMRRRVRHGAVLHVTLPLPMKLRSHGFSEPGYNMYAIVRRVELSKDETRIVGLEFIGKSPPAGYLYKPWATFRTQKWAGADRRFEPREERAEPVVVEFLIESMKSLGRTVGVTENISRGGARVCIKSSPPEFDLVKITNVDRTFDSLALVRNHYVERDGHDRLCLQFVNNKWPM